MKLPVGDLVRELVRFEVKVLGQGNAGTETYRLRRARAACGRKKSD